MKIGILGGSFNPPHLGHLHISEIAIKKLNLDQIWWIPTTQNPLKSSDNFLDFEQRILATKKFTEHNPKIFVKKIPNIYSIDLINFLQKKYPKYEFIWIAGADNLQNLHRWKNFDILIKKIEFAFFSREKFLLKINNYQSIKRYRFLKKSSKKLPRFRFFYNKNLDISSTSIRHQPNV
jgi:nicotinate-nucleotide adenylyltransferase